MMEVKILSSRSKMGLECAVNEFLHETSGTIIDIKFSTAGGTIGSGGYYCYLACEYSAMIVYDKTT